MFLWYKNPLPKGELDLALRGNPATSVPSSGPCGPVGTLFRTMSPFRRGTTTRHFRCRPPVLTSRLLPLGAMRHFGCQLSSLGVRLLPLRAMRHLVCRFPVLVARLETLFQAMSPFRRGITTRPLGCRKEPCYGKT